MLDFNNIDVNYQDYYDIKGDIFHILKDPEDELNFCLVREREGTYLIVGYSPNKMSFKKRIDSLK